MSFLATVWGRTFLTPYLGRRRETGVILAQAQNGDQGQAQNPSSEPLWSEFVRPPLRVAAVSMSPSPKLRWSKARQAIRLCSGRQGPKPSLPANWDAASPRSPELPFGPHLNIVRSPFLQIGGLTIRQGPRVSCRHSPTFRGFNVREYLDSLGQTRAPHVYGAHGCV